MKPIYYPSEIASLLGKNKYKPKEESLLRVLSCYPKHAYRIQALKKLHRPLTEYDMKSMVPKTVKESLQNAISIAVDTSDQIMIEHTIQKFQNDATSELLDNVLKGGEPITVEFEIAAKLIQDNASTAEKELERLKQTPFIQTLSQGIQKERGTRLEQTSAGTLSKLSGMAVTNRNTNVKYESDTYILSGSIDGQQENKVIEIKNRKHFWKEVPEYDIIQLRCYMKMKGNVDGILYETFPNQESRETVVHWDDAKWNEIHKELESISNYISNISQAELDGIALSVFTKMDRKVR